MIKGASWILTLSGAAHTPGVLAIVLAVVGTRRNTGSGSAASQAVLS